MPYIRVVSWLINLLAGVCRAEIRSDVAHSGEPFFLLSNSLMVTLICNYSVGGPDKLLP